MLSGKFGGRRVVDLSPGREFLAEWRAVLRIQLLEHPSSVIQEVRRVRIRHRSERNGSHSI
jgi:hypothetical protein